MSATENRALWRLRVPRGPNHTFGRGAPSIVWRDESFGEVGGDPLGEVGETDPHRSGPAR